MTPAFLSLTQASTVSAGGQIGYARAELFARSEVCGNN